MGVGLYLLIGLNCGTHKMRERYAEIDSKLLPMLPDNQECLSRIKEKIPKAGNIASYIQRNSRYPIYQNTDIKYFDEAVKGLEAQLEELAKAQKFIFMEYHAIEDAEAWHKIQDVLEERVKAGVEIKNDLIRTMGECRDVTDQYSETTFQKIVDFERSVLLCLIADTGNLHG